MEHVQSLPFKAFTRGQGNLNRFLWTTELIYGIVKQERILDRYPQDHLAWDVLSHVRSEAWFPTAKGRVEGDVRRSIKFRGTIGQLREQLDDNFVIILWTVAAMFVAEFESYVQARFPRWVEAQPKKGRVFMIPAPAQLLERLGKAYGTDRIKNIDPSTTLKADLMKTIRNLYVHKGLSGIPRRMNDAEIKGWIKMVTKGSSPYSVDQARSAVRDVIGGAVAKSRAATKDSKRLGEEFFYAIFAFTNIRNFAAALDASFPANA